MSNKQQKPEASPFFRPSPQDAAAVAGQKSTSAGVVRPKKQKRVLVVEETKSGIVGCTANMMTCIVGSGIVGVPYAVKQAGFGAGVFLIIFASLITEKSLRLLVSTAKHIHVPTFETAAEAAFGLHGFRFVLVNMFIIAYGAMVTYLMICKSSFSFVFRVTAEAKQQLVLFAISLTIMLPLSCLRDMANLDKTSRVAVLIDTLLVGLVAYSSPFEYNVKQLGGWWNLIKTDTIHYDTIFVGLGVLSFAFECQESAFLVAGSLERPTLQRWAKVTASALTICACLAMTCGVTGYVGYLDETKGNILDNMDPSSWTSTFAQAMLGVTMFATFPLASFVARHVCVVLLFKGRHAHEGEDSFILNRLDRRILLTVVLYLLAVLPATLFQDLGSVLALTGVIGGSCLAYIGPGMLYLGVHGGRFLELVNDSWLIPSRNSSDKAVSSGSRIIQGECAMEITPLVSKQHEKADFAETPIETHDKVRILPAVAWYLTGMPIWCKIASVGEKGVRHHVHELALHTPHPIRIGDVQYSLTESDGGTEAPSSVSDRAGVIIQRQSSAPIPDKNSVLIPPSKKALLLPLSKQEIKKKPVMEQGRSKQQAEGPLEPDPQQDPPAWKDFFIAIFYICFGVVALVAGLVSLYADSSNSEIMKTSTH